jgi:hypothetical protein
MMRLPALILVILNMGVATACSCIDVGLAGHFARADFVFEAISLGSRVIEQADTIHSRMDRVTTMKVTKVYKGDLHKGTVKVFTSRFGASCGSWLPFGGRYLVFGTTWTEGLPRARHAPSVYTGLCRGNKFYPFSRFGLRKNIRRLMRGEELPEGSRWSGSPSF